MHYRELLRITVFRDLWLGQAISQLGDAFYYVTFMFMVKQVTKSDDMVGYVGALETLPFLLVGPYAGVLADRVDRRRLMLWSDLISGIVLLALASMLAVQGQPPLWSLLVTPFLLSTIRVFFLPAKSASIPSLVPGERVHQANALSMATQNLMPLIGLGLSASVLASLYGLAPKWFFTVSIALNAVSFFLSAIFVARLPRLEPDRSSQHASHPWTDFRDGLAYIWRRHDLRVMLPLLTTFRLAVAPFFVAYLAANEKWFDNKPQTVAWLEFFFFVGMVVASAYVGRFAPRRPAVWFCAGLGFVGVTVAMMAWSTNFWLFAFWNLLAGLAVPPADVPMTTYLQASTPDAYRGRVNAAIGIVASGAMPIGYALGGTIVKNLGLPAMFLLMGGGMVLACLVGALDPRFRNVRMPDPEEIDSGRSDRPVAAVAL